MSEVDLLAGILSKTGAVVAGVGTDQLSLPTPCDAYDVETLRNHIVGWLLVFEAGCHGRAYDGDAANYRCGADPAREFRTAADSLIAGWEKYGLDRQVAVTGATLPAGMVLTMTIMEYLTHGWDLAVATGQPIPFTDQEAAEALTRAEATLPPHYRGENKAFGQIVPVDEHAPALDRFVAFLGRKPVAAPAG